MKGTEVIITFFLNIKLFKAFIFSFNKNSNTLKQNRLSISPSSSKLDKLYALYICSSSKLTQAISSPGKALAIYSFDGSHLIN